MSKFDWKKDLKESLIDASIMTIGLYGISWIGTKAGIPKPNFSMTAENVGKVGIYLTIADIAKEYVKTQIPK